MKETAPDAAIDEDSLCIQEYRDGGDAECLARIYEKYRECVFLRCLSMVGNVEEAKDLAGDTFVKAFEHLETFRVQSTFAPWLNRIAANLCIDFLRQKNRRRFQLLSRAEETAVRQSDANQDETLDSRKKILRAIRQLKLRQRRCFCLFYIHGLSYKEIARITGYSNDEVRSHIQNGRRRFRILMEKT